MNRMIILQTQERLAHEDRQHIHFTYGEACYKTGRLTLRVQHCCKIAAPTPTLQIRSVTNVKASHKGVTSLQTSQQWKITHGTQE